MKKLILLFTFLSFSLYAQKAIELKPTGEVFPRVALTSTTDIATVGAPTLSQMVYNTNIGLADGAGYYFWNGTIWTKLGAGAAGTLPSTAIVLSETATNTALQTAGFLNSGKAMIPFQGWEKLFSATNEFTNKEAKEDYAYQPFSNLTDFKYWVFWGGVNSAGTYQNNGKYYKFNTDSWINLPAPPAGFDARRYHTLNYIGEQIVIWGGNSTSSNASALGTGAVMNIDENGAGTWTLMSNTNAPDPRGRHSSVPFYNGSISTAGAGSGIIIWGGVNGSNGIEHSGKIWRGTSNGWDNLDISTTNDPTSRFNHYAFSRHNYTPLGGGVSRTYMYIWGGQGAGSAYLNTGGVYNSNTDSWTTISNTNPPVNDEDVSITHTSFGGTKILVYGGGNNGSSSGGGKIWTESTDTWTNMSTENAPKLTKHSAIVKTVDGNDYMFLWGGYISNGVTVNDKIWTYDITNNEWLTPADFQVGVTPNSSQYPFIVSHGEQIGVYGGTNASDVFQTAGGLFNPFKLKPYYLFKKQ